MCNMKLNIKKQNLFLIILSIVLISLVPNAESIDYSTWVPPMKQFTKIIVGASTIQSHNTYDNFTMVAGSGITLTPDTTHNKITFSTSLGPQGTLDTMQNIGGGQASIYKGNSSNTNFQFKTINATSPLLITNGTNSLSISCPTCTVSSSGSVNATSPANQTGTSSVPGVMEGAYITITPQTTGRISINVSGYSQSTLSGDGCKIQIRYGAYNLGANGAALAGSALGTGIQAISGGAGAGVPFSRSYDLTGLSLGTKQYIDLSQAQVNGGTCTLYNIMWFVNEF